MSGFKGQYGFNLLWGFVKGGEGGGALEPDEKALEFIAGEGFNFIRLPLDYRIWTNDFDYTHPDGRMLEKLDRCVGAVNRYGLHACINLHRAPGYCCNRPDLERDSLFADAEAQEGFIYLWRNFAQRYKHLTNGQISFDLVNEPADIVRGYSVENYDRLVRRTTAAIRAVSPERTVVADGVNWGHDCVPSLSDFDVIQSGRGYQPAIISHYGAEWWKNYEWESIPPDYPGLSPDGEKWDKDWLRAFYAPWRALEDQGVRVHIGECGCYDKIPNDTAMRWLTDLFSLYAEYSWGYSLWNFEGSFGIIGHRRPGAKFEDYKGYLVDRPLLELLKENRK